jgi:hypothetical protein
MATPAASMRVNATGNPGTKMVSETSAVLNLYCLQYCAVSLHLMFIMLTTVEMGYATLWLYSHLTSFINVL